MQHNFSRVMYVIVGTFKPKGGMFEYFKAMLDQSLDANQEVAIAAPEELIAEFSGGGKCRSFSLGAGLNYRDLVISREVHGKRIKKLIDNLSIAIQNFDPQLVHFTDITLYSDYVLFHLARRFGHMTIFQTLHDPKFHEENISLPALFLKKLQYKRFSRLFSSTGSLALHVHDKRLLKGSPFPDTLRFVEMQHPLPKCQTVRQRPFCREKVRIGFMGRIEKYKGLDDLYDAFEILIAVDREIQDKFEIVIVGNGFLETEKWLSLPCPVRIINEFIDDETFHREMADLDLLVLPYRTATQSGVLAMAVSYGIPAIATKVGALDQLLINDINGFLVEPCSPQALAAALSKVLVQPAVLGALHLNAISRMRAAGASVFEE